MRQSAAGEVGQPAPQALLQTLGLRVAGLAAARPAPDVGQPPHLSRDAVRVVAAGPEPHQGRGRHAHALLPVVQVAHVGLLRAVHVQLHRHVEALVSEERRHGHAGQPYRHHISGQLVKQLAGSEGETAYRSEPVDVLPHQVVPPSPRAVTGLGLQQPATGRVAVLHVQTAKHLRYRRRRQRGQVVELVGRDVAVQQPALEGAQQLLVPLAGGRAQCQPRERRLPPHDDGAHRLAEVLSHLLHGQQQQEDEQGGPRQPPQRAGQRVTSGRHADG